MTVQAALWVPSGLKSSWREIFSGQRSLLPGYLREQELKNNILIKSRQNQVSCLIKKVWIYLLLSGQSGTEQLVTCEWIYLELALVFRDSFLVPYSAQNILTAKLQINPDIWVLAPKHCPSDALETLWEVIAVKCQNLFENLVPGDHKKSDSSLFCTLYFSSFLNHFYPVWFWKALQQVSRPQWEVLCFMK